MSSEDLPQKIKKVRTATIAIGYQRTPNKVTIMGSGFCVSDNGKVLSAAHIFKQTPEQYRSKLLSMTIVKQEQDGSEHYKWLPLNLIKSDDKNDLAVFQISDYQTTLLKPLVLGDSDKIEVGQEAYFIGFPYAARLMNQGLGITLIVNRTIVSNIKRDGLDKARPRNLFIVDSISNPGNSGSPLIGLETNKVIGIMTIAFRTKSQIKKYNDLDIREPMHIAGAKPINLAKSILANVN